MLKEISIIYKTNNNMVIRVKRMEMHHSKTDKYLLINQKSKEKGLKIHASVSFRGFLSAQLLK